MQVGLKYKIICQEISDTESIIGELIKIENDILKNELQNAKIMERLQNEMLNSFYYR